MEFLTSFIPSANDILEGLQHAQDLDPADHYGAGALLLDHAAGYASKNSGTQPSTWIPTYVKVRHEGRWIWTPLRIRFSKMRLLCGLPSPKGECETAFLSRHLSFSVTSTHETTSTEGKCIQRFGQAMFRLNRAWRMKVLEAITWGHIRNSCLRRYDFVQCYGTRDYIPPTAIAPTDASELSMPEDPDHPSNNPEWLPLPLEQRAVRVKLHFDPSKMPASPLIKIYDGNAPEGTLATLGGCPLNSDNAHRAITNQTLVSGVIDMSSTVLTPIGIVLTCKFASLTLYND